MKKITTILFLAAILCISAAAQKISKPTLTPVELTAAQKELINEGVALHDEKRFDDAIAVYQLVLKENPDSVLAIYELSLTYYIKKDYKNALDYLGRGIKYKSDLLSSFYRLIGSIADDTGNPKQAIKVYQDALKITPDDPVIHYDLGITQIRLENFKEAKESFKKSIELDFSYPSPHSVLASYYFQKGYRVPSLLAAMRLLSLEINTPRSQAANKIILEVLGGNVEKSNDGSNKITIFMNPDAPTDEGDFTTIDLILSMSNAAGNLKDKKDKTNKTDEDKFVDSIKTFVSFIEEDKKNKSTFVGKNYFPFLIEMKKRGFVEPFAYLIMQQTGNKTAEKWLTDNSKTTLAFVDWANSYK